MCDYCSPSSGEPGHTPLKLRTEVRRLNVIEASRRGLTLEEYLDDPLRPSKSVPLWGGLWDELRQLIGFG